MISKITTMLIVILLVLFFFFSSRRRHTRSDRDWSSDVCSSDLDDRLLRAEVVRVVDGRREEVDRLHERDLVVEAEHRRVVARRRAHEQARVFRRDRKSVV